MIYLVLAIIGSIVAAVIASGKQRNVVGWCLFGLVLPVIAVVAILCLPAATPQHQLPRAS